MARAWHRLLLGTALLGLLTTGCHRDRHRCLCRCERLAAGPPLVVSQPRPATGTESVPAEIVPPPAPVPTEQEEKPAPPQEAVAVAAHPAPARGAASPFHAPDYRWLIGELQYVHVRNAWRLRYAPPDEDDPLGGTMTLVEPGPMTAYRSGQIVRVEGELVDPASREPSPPYRVRSIQPAVRP